MFKKQVSKKATTKKAVPLTRYQRFGLFFFTRVRVTLLLWLLLASFGVACYTTFMQRAGFPDIAAPYSSITGTYFVNDREKVDKQVAQPLAVAVGKVDGVKHVTSQSGDNFFSVQIEFDENITSEQGNQRVKQSIERQKILPTSAEAAFKPFFVTKLTFDGDDLLISIGSKTLSTAELQSRAEEIAKALGDGGSAEIKDARRVTVIDNYRHGTDPATGQVVSQQQSFDWIATPKDGELSFAKSAIVAVQARPGVDVLHLDTEAQASLQKLRADPRFDGLQIEVAADFARDIRMQINGLQENLLGGLLAVLVVSFLLISLRASLVTAVSMVTVLAITVGLLYVFGLSLNTITLFALLA